jgi:hypothetical protein
VAELDAAFLQSCRCAWGSCDVPVVEGYAGSEYLRAKSALASASAEMAKATAEFKAKSKAAR